MTQNNVIVSGRIAFEPKVYDTKKGGKIATAVLNVYQGKGKDDKPSYASVNVKVFDSKLAESLMNLGKSADIVVIGKLGEDAYEKDGKTVRSLYVNASYVGVDA